MERNRETRRASILGSNGFKRRRNRANSLRDSPDEDGRVELQESVRLRRDRVKKDRDLRERVRGLRERDLRRHSKRRRRRAEDETSEESFNDDDDEDEENIAAAAASAGRLFPPPSGSVSDHHHRKSFPPGFSSSSSSSKILRASPVWKPGDGIISSSVPRKARSAITKRSHDWNSSSSNNINVCAGSVGGATEKILRQASISPTRQSGAVSTSTPSQAAPKSPPSSSSNSFFLKKLKTGPNLKPPKSAPSKQNSSNCEDLEIEIAEVLYGLMTQSHGPSSRKEDPKESFPISTSGPTKNVAPKRKRPRQVEEDSGRVDGPGPNAEKVVEMHQAPEAVISSPSPERISGESGFEVRGNLVNSQEQPTGPAVAEKEITESTMEKETCVVKKEDKFCNDSGSTATAFSSVTNITSKSKVSDVDIQREHKFEIDLMAPPPQEQSSPDSQKSILSTDDAESKPADKENEEEKSAKGHNRSNLAAEESKSKEEIEEIDLQFDTGKTERNENKLQQQQEMLIGTNKEEMPLPLPMGYMASQLQQVVSMDGPTVAPLIQLFTQPRPKRCATHSYIARNIHCMQQLMKTNPFWQAAAGPASLFGSKPCNPIVMPTDPAGNVAGKGLHNDNAQGKGHSVATNLNHGVNDKISQNASSSDSARRKQTVAPSSLLGPTFIFPYQQQPAVAASASARPNPTKPLSTTGASSSSNPTVMSFNYPSMPANEAQYLAILQNNGYPMPPIGPPPNYRGPPAQAMPFLNGSFYPSQMIHPSQIQHHQKTPPTQQSHNNLSGQQPRPQSSNGGPGSTNNLTRKSQQSSQQSLPSNNNQHGHVSRLGREDGPTTTTDSSRGSRAPVNMYGPKFTLPMHPQNLTMMTQSSNHTEKGPQLPQQFAMSFGTINPGIDVASMAQNHAIFQNFQEATRQNIQNMMVAAAAAAQSGHNNNNSNGPIFTEHLKSNISPSQSAQWKNTSRTPTSQAPSSLASSTALKNHNSRPATQTQNKISFGANPKPTTTNSQGQAPMSPTNSSVSKGSSRTTSSNSTNTKTGQSPFFPAQQQKNPPSILGNPNAVKTQMQPQLFFSNPYSPSTSSITSGLNGFYTQQRVSDQHQHHGPLKSMSTNDPAKAFAAATSNVQGIMHAAHFGRPGGGTFLPAGFSYVHPVPAAVQVKPTEQKRPAGNDNLHAWQPDKK